MKIENTSVDILSKAVRVKETKFIDEVDSLLSIGFKLIGICPQNNAGELIDESESFQYSLMWDGIVKEGVSDEEFRRIQNLFLN